MCAAKTKNTDQDTDFPIVGIGASAGGLAAISQLLSSVPSKPGLAFVLVQHFDAKHPSHAAEIYSKVSRIPVHQIKNGLRIEANQAYVIPPGYNLTIKGGIFKLVRPKDRRHQRAPIDFFFQSLALEKKEEAIGVILSGTATDGAQGLKAIKAQGGTIIVQEPESAEFDGMPRAAIATGLIDLILPAQKIYPGLANVANLPSAPDLDSFSTDEALRKILKLLRDLSYVDFSHYKQATVIRRIQRRMMALKLESFENYAIFCQSHPEEVKALHEDIFIHVTGFFRDPQSFEALKALVFPKLIKNRSKDLPIRIWVPGCSTGEEAYSIAISLLEFLDKTSSAIQFQLFATDISEAAIQTARKGIYSEKTLEDLSSERRAHFFDKVKDGYKIKKEVRERCIFSKHDVTNNPPFAKLDLLSFRNVLIYFSAPLQKRITPLFHYALNSGGYLFLGRSETPSHFSGLFEAVDSKNKIYSKITTGTQARYPLPPNRFEAEKFESLRPGLGYSTPGADLQKDADRIVMSKYAPASLVINAHHEILQLRGNTGLYLELASGLPNYNLFKMIRPELLSSLRVVIQTAKKTNVASRKEKLVFKYDDRKRVVNIEVTPINPTAPLKERQYLILLENVPQSSKSKGLTELSTKKSRSGKKAQDQIIEKLQQELEASLELQQSLTIDFDSAQEELTSSNEELQSTNEELQSTNEELETATEELQATNEELTTTNDELHKRNLELNSLNVELAKETAHVQLFEAVTVAANEATSVDEALQLFLDQTCVHTGWEVGHVYLLTESGEFRSTNIWHFDQPSRYRELQRATANPSSIRSGPFLEEILVTKKFKLSQDISQNSGFPEALAAKNAGIKSAFAFPVLIGHSVVAVLEFYSIKPIKPDDRFLQLMSRMSVQLGRLIERKKFEEREKERTKELLEANEALTKIQANLKAAITSRDDFLSVASHELKTPITSLKLNLQLAAQHFNPDTKVTLAPEVLVQSLKSSVQQVDRLTHLIEDLLDISKVQAGKLTLKLEDVDLSGLVQEAAQRFVGLAEEANCGVELEFRDKVIGHWDPMRLDQVVTNLLSNAIKYAPGKPIKVLVEKVGRFAVLVIQDFGPGIPKEKQASVFERFERATSSKNISGLGLGLFIVKQIVVALKGSIQLESEPGHGSKFTVLLPLRAD